MTEVVAALIWNNNKFLICQRPANKERAFLWEFVGGKVEPGETKEQALIRECKEELAVTLSVGDMFMEVTHEYSDITVHLTLFNATIAEGEPQKLEHNDIQWIAPSEIPNYEFCPADEEILNKLQKAVYDNVDITEIKKTCSMVRTAAYRSYINGDLPVGKETPFPNGLCGWVSIVLGAVLSNEFPDEKFFYVSGMSGEMSHAWIEYYDYVIDITADQFQEVTEEVLIVQRSDSSLHTRFEIEKSVRLNDEFLKYYLHYKEENSIYQEYLKLKQLPRNVEL